MRHFGWNSKYSVALFCLMFALVVGCSDSGSEDTSTDDKEARHSNGETTSVTASKPSIESSPAERKSDLPPRDASPRIVCQRFLELLQTGKRMTAEHLLTRTALAVTGRADLQLEPLGSDAAKYVLGQPQYATNKQLLAQVNCKIIDDIGGEHFESEITWLVRKQREGWRISGILIQLEEDAPQDLLSFENRIDVLKMKNAIAGDEPAGERQAAVPDEVSNR